MFYEILQKFFEDKKNVKIWKFLNMDRTYWCQIKKNNKLTLKHYKKICECINHEICDDHHTISKLLVELYYAP
jgi:hypothetical protein